jgi:tryptophan aminotransferase
VLTGNPNPTVFPLAGVTITAREPGILGDAPLTTLEITPEHVAVGLQYGAVAGWQPFIDWLAELQYRQHGRSIKEGWRLTVGLGSNDMIYKVLFTH